jgi:hypothetical protein
MNWYKKAKFDPFKIYSGKENWKALTPEERKQVKEKFGNDLECSFAKDEDGYFCYTHRARSDSYESVDKIPKSKVEFIEGTG